MKNKTKTWSTKIDPELIDRLKELVNRDPRFRSLVHAVDLALRDFLEKHEQSES